jgi:hypothetical protein
MRKFSWFRIHANPDRPPHSLRSYNTHTLPKEKETKKCTERLTKLMCRNFYVKVMVHNNKSYLNDGTPQTFARSPIQPDSAHPEHSGFKQAFSCKFTMYESDCLKQFLLSGRSLNFEKPLRHTTVLLR